MRMNVSIRIFLEGIKAWFFSFFLYWEYYYYYCCQDHHYLFYYLMFSVSFFSLLLFLRLYAILGYASSLYALILVFIIYIISKSYPSFIYLSFIRYSEFNIVENITAFLLFYLFINFLCHFIYTSSLLH